MEAKVSSSEAWDILVQRHGLADDKEYKPVFEQLEKAIDSSLVNRIKHLEKRCVLLVGSDKDLVRKIACLIYYHSGTLGFYYVDCLNEKNIEGKLSQAPGGTVFFEDLNSKDLPLIKRLCPCIEGFLNSGYYSYTINGVKKTIQGQLIISVPDRDNLPEYFTSWFDFVELQKHTSKNVHSGKGEGIQTLYYDDAESILFLDGENHQILTKKEQELFDYLKNGDRDVFDITDEIWNAQDRKNFDPCMHKLNKKISEKFGLELIRNLEEGNGRYGISARIEDKKFKKQDAGKMKARRKKPI